MAHRATEHVHFATGLTRSAALRRQHGFPPKLEDSAGHRGNRKPVVEESKPVVEEPKIKPIKYSDKLGIRGNEGNLSTRFLNPPKVTDTRLYVRLGQVIYSKLYTKFEGGDESFFGYITFDGSEIKSFAKATPSTIACFCANSLSNISIPIP